MGINTYHVNINMTFHRLFLSIVKEKNFWIIVIISVIFVNNAPFLLLKNIVNTDEFPSLAVPAYYAGYDWSSFVSNLKFHGYGFTLLFFPLFKVLKSSEYIYMLIKFGALILRIVMALLAFGICSKIFSLNYRTAAVIAIICDLGSLSVDDGIPLSAMSELPFGFVVLISTLFFIKSWQNHGKKRILYIGLMCAFMGYSYTIHSRAIIMWFSFVFVLILYLLLHKEFDKKLFLYLAMFISIIVIVEHIDSITQNDVWKAIDGKELANSVSAVASSSIIPSIKKLFSFESQKIAIFTFSSLLGTLTIYTGGTIWLFTAINISAVFALHKKKAKEDKMLLVITLFGIISFYIMNASIAISSTGAVKTDNLRWLTYIRYCKPFGFLFVLTAMVALFKDLYNKNFVRNFWIIGVCISLIILNSKTARHLQTTGYNLQYSVLSRVFYDKNIETVMEYFGKMSLICLTLTAIAIIFWNKNSKLKMIAVYAFFSILINIETYDYCVYRDSIYTERTDAAKEVATFDYIKNGDIYIGGTATYAIYLYWNLYRSDILYQNDRADIVLKENTIYFTDSIEDRKVMNASYIFILDSNEYMFTSDSLIAQNMNKDGYELYIK